MHSTFFIPQLWVLLFGCTFSQQLMGFPMPMSWPGISVDCETAMNTTVNCPFFLGRVSVNLDSMTPDELDALCTSSCRSSLESARSIINAACTLPTDQIIINGAHYPASLIAEQYLLTHTVSCVMDPATNDFCDTIFQTWLNDPLPQEELECHDCVLSVEYAQLGSPLGYDEDMHSQFVSQTAACGKNGYGNVVSTPYTLTPTTTVTTSYMPTPSCASTYTVQAGDRCHEIAAANGVSTFSILILNGFTLDCEALQAGTTLCLGTMCDTYTLPDPSTGAPEATCDDVLTANPGLTVTDLLLWNPYIRGTCRNLYNVRAPVLCVGPPGGTPSNQATTIYAPTEATTAAPVPTDAPTGSNVDCGRWYQVEAGDTCNFVSVKFAIPLTDFYFLNSDLDSQCTNLWVGNSYCVQPVGPIEHYPGYESSDEGTPTTTYFTLTPTTMTTESGTLDPMYYYVPTPTAALPHAPGTLNDCTSYRDYEVVVPIEAAAFQRQKPIADASVNSCQNVILDEEVSLENFMTWNPSLSSANCKLQEGYSYCVAREGVPAYQPPSPYKECSTTVHQNGTAEDCTCYHFFEAYDDGFVTCEGFANDHDITVDDMRAWNSFIGEDCEADIWGDLDPLDSNAGKLVCYKTGNVTTTPTPTTMSTITASPTASMGPTPSGVASGCASYYTVRSGDSCASIQSQYGITFNDFYAWNSPVGDNCQFLVVGNAYCVSPPPGATTTTASPPAPTRTGTRAGCAAYHTVVAGDGCESIEIQYDITFDMLYTWNTDIGANCEALWTGYGVCVAASIRSGTPPTCSAYYTVRSGDSCVAITDRYGISFSQLLAWNTDIGGNCESLWLDTALCVAGGP